MEDNANLTISPPPVANDNTKSTPTKINTSTKLPIPPGAPKKNPPALPISNGNADQLTPRKNTPNVVKKLNYDQAANKKGKIVEKEEEEEDNDSDESNNSDSEDSRSGSGQGPNGSEDESDGSEDESDNEDEEETTKTTGTVKKSLSLQKTDKQLEGGLDTASSNPNTSRSSLPHPPQSSKKRMPRKEVLPGPNTIYKTKLTMQKLTESTELTRSSLIDKQYESAQLLLADKKAEARKVYWTQKKARRGTFKKLVSGKATQAIRRNQVNCVGKKSVTNLAWADRFLDIDGITLFVNFATKKIETITTSTMHEILSQPIRAVQKTLLENPEIANVIRKKYNKDLANVPLNTFLSLFLTDQFKPKLKQYNKKYAHQEVEKQITSKKKQSTRNDKISGANDNSDKMDTDVDNNETEEVPLKHNKKKKGNKSTDAKSIKKRKVSTIPEEKKDKVQQKKKRKVEKKGAGEDKEANINLKQVEQHSKVKSAGANKGQDTTKEQKTPVKKQVVEDEVEESDSDDEDTDGHNAAESESSDDENEESGEEDEDEEEEDDDE